jgi:hypothetical protein
MDTWVLWYHDGTWVHGCLDTWVRVLMYMGKQVLGCMGTWVLENKIRWALGHISIWVHHYLGTQLPRSMDPCIHGPYVHGSLGLWVLGYMVICAYTGTWVPILPTALCAQVVMCQSTQVPTQPCFQVSITTSVYWSLGARVLVYICTWILGC